MSHVCRLSMHLNLGIQDFGSSTDNSKTAPSLDHRTMAATLPIHRECRHLTLHEIECLLFQYKYLFAYKMHAKIQYEGFKFQDNWINASMRIVKVAGGAQVYSKHSCTTVSSMRARFELSCAIAFARAAPTLASSI